jgi:hypothetical protein
MVPADGAIIANQSAHKKKPRDDDEGAELNGRLDERGETLSTELLPSYVKSGMVPV